jgi:hypothetical protein
VPNLDTLAGIEAATTEEEARLAADLARLAERRAEGRDTTAAEVLVRVDRGRLAEPTCARIAPGCSRGCGGRRGRSSRAGDGLRPRCPLPPDNVDLAGGCGTRASQAARNGYSKLLDKCDFDILTRLIRGS